MASRLTRRQIGLGALGLSAMAQAPTKYSGALDGFENQVTLADFDPVAWTLLRYQQTPRRLRFEANNLKQAQAWQKKLRAKLVELLGLAVPVPRVALDAKILESREFNSYRREKVVFTSRPGLAVLAYVLTPKQRKAPHPAVICLPGHGRGVDDIVGIDEQGRDRTDRSGYQHDFAIQVVERGLAAVAIEQMAFGCRRDARTKKGGLGRSACQPVAGAALLLGETMIGWRVWDVMRTLDYLETRPDIDSRRIGVTGISGGGTVTVFSAALEPRLQAAFASGYLNTFRDSIFSLSHCIDNYVPGILQWAEMYEVAGLIAPRPFFAESGAQDEIFPLQAFRESVSQLQRIYEVMGARDRLESEVFPAGHVWHGVRGLSFLAQHLGA
ncbi:MAG: alpha/beta hydrolase family protein [Bryobacteraceae bacterium]|nr:alpha/beta hydrolase family protein [Bryobacteraceae bacterium]MDW8378003.1 alpha/beta hydrolase family protein [Bryobacterales bacterium]